MSIDTILTIENKSLHCRRIAFPGLFLEQVALGKIQFIVSGCDYRVRVGDQATDEPVLEGAPNRAATADASTIPP